MGLAELGVILAIMVLLFGAKRLPALADGMGKAIRNFKRGLSTDDEDVTPADKQVAEKSSAEKLDEAGKAHADSKS
jgi:sec-independent protein translocase protein TatA